MKNLDIGLNLVDGSYWPLEPLTGKELITMVFGDDFAAPPRTLAISATDEYGRRVTILVPYDHTSDTYVEVVNP